MTSDGVPSLGSDQDSVYDTLVRRFLRQQLEGLTGEGLVLGVGEKADWVDVLPARAGLAVRRAIRQPEHELAAVAAADWVVLDRRLQAPPRCGGRAPGSRPTAEARRPRPHALHRDRAPRAGRVRAALERGAVRRPPAARGVPRARGRRGRAARERDARAGSTGCRRTISPSRSSPPSTRCTPCSLPLQPGNEDGAGERAAG